MARQIITPYKQALVMMDGVVCVLCMCIKNKNKKKITYIDYICIICFFDEPAPRGTTRSGLVKRGKTSPLQGFIMLLSCISLYHLLHTKGETSSLYYDDGEFIGTVCGF